MSYRSLYSTPENTPLRPQIVEASTPWSEVSLEDHASHRFESPRGYRKLIRSFFRAHLRNWNRTLWLAMFLAYVGRWLSTSDGVHKHGSFPEKQSLQSATIPAKPLPALPFLPLTNTSNAAPISLLARVDDDEYIVLPNATSILMPIEGTPVDEDEWLTGNQAGNQALPPASTKKKMLEIVTDFPGSMAGRDKHKNTRTARGILGGVMGWESLLPDMFGADHATIGMDGMCLIEDCIGGRGSPFGLADVFFQSGPAGTDEYSHAWIFQEYTPDVIVMNIGNSDWDSFQSHYQEYNKTLWELSVVFEETYISMIKAIRTLAYPKYSTSIDSRYTYTARNAAVGIPIFIMRPFRGQLEQATHSVVDRLQKEGDKAIFWLDTSGWLNTEVDFQGRAEDQDFFLDEESPSKQWRLTERGNQRVAILLHMHVCRYLARDREKCAFLPPEIYQGKALDHEAIHFDEFLENERERKLKKMFWK
ncbi:uncharacterized protein LY89DRAFT_755212 [Mollisia scopiformis]|uniref:Uncharacterized protein n=1 Tax=Mollisia scopiformis TaxID=149040 RepID=A0A194XSZ9_MOLSC|nr:uncharacterized protein LY89DRAFT_755212 [Mollisia scopiformis]KUJ23323.1 hypothetical protein LY89DRAFT_755212 [Mollisia scopiformis]